MNRPFTQRLIAILCLVAVGLGQTLFASIGVRCTDATGETRIEYPCIKAPDGACLTSCGARGPQSAHQSHDSDPTAPTPCEDEPLGSQASAAKLIPDSFSLKPVFVAAAVAIVSDPWSCADEQPVCLHQRARGRDRPPDWLARLRSVILMV